ncbi:restriction endonuclease subunit S [Morganella morganii]|uniref:restriction endonuclease subunit S n=1 Tax=Morganella morganii TaxID=582 RepID=UPI0030FE91AD
MSELSYLEKLLNGTEIELLPLSSLCELITTGKLNANAMEDNGAYPFFTCNEEPYRINTYAFDLEAILISGNGSQVGHLNYYNGKFNAYQRTYILGEFNENVDIMYLYYYLMHTLKHYIHKNSKKGSVPYITMPMLENFTFPIPCPNTPEKSLAIQSEIVRILDAFTALTAELTAELTARKKQYDYYRDQLLSFKYGWISPYMEKLLDGVEVEWLPLELIAKIKHGKDWKGLGKGIVPVYGSGGVMGYVDTCSYDQPSVLIPRKGSITNIFYVEAPFWNVDTIYYTDIETSKIIPKYLYHFIKTIDLMALDTGSGRPSLTQAILNKLHIPIPCPNNPEKSLSIQAEIVRILDKFDKLTGSITEGLPREIELRQKQYEYYRDLLFSFPKPESVNN